jgi:hypothetical protein
LKKRLQILSFFCGFVPEFNLLLVFATKMPNTTEYYQGAIEFKPAMISSRFIQYRKPLSNIHVLFSQSIIEGLKCAIATLHLPSQIQCLFRSIGYLSIDNSLCASGTGIIIMARNISTRLNPHENNKQHFDFIK